MAEEVQKLLLLKRRQAEILSALDQAFAHLLGAQGTQPAPTLADKAASATYIQNLPSQKESSVCQALAKAYAHIETVNLDTAVQWWLNKTEPQQYQAALKDALDTLTNKLWGATQYLSNLQSSLNSSHAAPASPERVKQLRLAGEAIRKAESQTASLASINSTNFPYWPRTSPRPRLSSIAIATVLLMIVTAAVAYIWRHYGAEDSSAVPALSQAVRTDAAQLAQSVSDAPEFIDKITALLKSLKDLFTVIPALVGAAGGVYALFTKARGK